MAAGIGEDAREEEVVAEGRERGAEVGLRRHELSDARLERLGQPDPEVDAERIADLLTPERAGRAVLRVGPANDLADEPAVGAHVVTVLRSRLPDRLLPRERVDHALPRQRFFQREVAFDERESGLMRHRLTDGDRALAVGRELRPQRRDRRLGVERPPLDQQVGADRGDTLRRGVHQHERILLPAHSVRRVGETAPEIDDGFPVEVHAHCRADFPAVVEVPGERVDDRFEFGGDIPVDRHAPECNSAAPEATMVSDRVVDEERVSCTCRPRPWEHAA